MVLGINTVDLVYFSKLCRSEVMKDRKKQIN